MIKILDIKKDLQIRLDKYLKDVYTSLNQSFIEKNIRKKNILVNNFKTQAKYILKKNDYIKILNYHPEKYKNKIVYRKKEKTIPNKLLNNFLESIVYKNNNFIILNKWSGITTQGGSNINLSIDDIIKSISSEYKLVHRLDKETSGLLIISKNLEYAKIFGNLFKSKSIEKIYIAICEGKPKNNESYIDLNIKDNKSNKILKTQTYFKLLNYKNGLSQIMFKPETGKKHQIRIVSKNLGCPIIGDNKYNFQSKYKNNILKLNAYGLKFEYKETNYVFYADIPKDFNEFSNKLKLKNFISFKKNLQFT